MIATTEHMGPGELQSQFFRSPQPKHVSRRACSAIGHPQQRAPPRRRKAIYPQDFSFQMATQIAEQARRLKVHGKVDAFTVISAKDHTTGGHACQAYQK